MNFEIRRARQEDAEGIIAAHRRSIREVCVADYSSEQIAAWSGRDFRIDRWHQSMERDLVWVVADESDRIFGFGHLQFSDQGTAQLAGLYFAPEIIGRGFGRKLVEQIKEECAKREVAEIHLTASKTAKQFYLKAGFSQVGEAVNIQFSDQLLDCFKMKLVI